MLISDLQKIAHQDAKEKGFWDKERNDGELIALMHSELSEALEGLRADSISNVAEELADCMIRIADFAEARSISLTVAIHEKLAFNKTRPYKHGKEF